MQVYLRNRPAISELSRIYPAGYMSNDFNAYLGNFIAHLRNLFQHTKLAVLRAHLQPGDLIVEVGPGAGDYLDLVRRVGDSTWEVLGVEFSETAAKAMRRRGLPVVQQRIEEVEHFHRPVGAFVMNQLIEHVENPRLVLRKCSHALRPNGIVVLETPNLLGWETKVLPLRYWGGWHAPRHWSVFDFDTLSKLSKEEELEVVKYSSILSPYNLLQTTQAMLRERWGMRRLAKYFDVNHLLPLFCVSVIDQLVIMLGGTTSNMQVVLRKPQAEGQIESCAFHRAVTSSRIG
jgi:2-polyprenyl-3-methyl-5-hydroxy-6-metoxy-1,4-benzoquinol methylase